MAATSNIECRTLNSERKPVGHQTRVYDLEPGLLEFAAVRIFNASIQTAERNKLNRRRQSGRL